MKQIVVEVEPNVFFLAEAQLDQIHPDMNGLFANLTDLESFEDYSNYFRAGLNVNIHKPVTIIDQKSGAVKVFHPRVSDSTPVTRSLFTKLDSLLKFALNDAQRYITVQIANFGAQVITDYAMAHGHEAMMSSAGIPRGTVSPAHGITLPFAALRDLPGITFLASVVDTSFEQVVVPALTFIGKNVISTVQTGDTRELLMSFHYCALVLNSAFGISFVPYGTVMNAALPQSITSADFIPRGHARAIEALGYQVPSELTVGDANEMMIDKLEHGLVKSAGNYIERLASFIVDSWMQDPFSARRTERVYQTLDDDADRISATTRDIVELTRPVRADATPIVIPPSQVPDAYEYIMELHEFKAPEIESAIRKLQAADVKLTMGLHNPPPKIIQDIRFGRSTGVNQDIRPSDFARLDRTPQSIPQDIRGPDFAELSRTPQLIPQDIRVPDIATLSRTPQFIPQDIRAAEFAKLSRTPQLIPQDIRVPDFAALGRTPQSIPQDIRLAEYAKLSRTPVATAADIRGPDFAALGRTPQSTPQDIRLPYLAELSRTPVATSKDIRRPEITKTGRTTVKHADIRASAQFDIPPVDTQTLKRSTIVVSKPSSAATLEAQKVRLQLLNEGASTSSSGLTQTQEVTYNAIQREFATDPEGAQSLLKALGIKGKPHLKAPTTLLQSPADFNVVQSTALYKIPSRISDINDLSALSQRQFDDLLVTTPIPLRSPLGMERRLQQVSRDPKQNSASAYYALTSLKAWRKSSGAPNDLRLALFTEAVDQVKKGIAEFKNRGAL